MDDAPRIFDDGYVSAISLIPANPSAAQANPAAAHANPAAAPASAAPEKEVTETQAGISASCAPVTSFSGADIDPDFFAPSAGADAVQQDVRMNHIATGMSGMVDPFVLPPGSLARLAAEELAGQLATPLPGNGEALQELQPAYLGVKVEALQEQPAFPAFDSTAEYGSAANPIVPTQAGPHRRCVVVPQPGGGPLHNKIGPSTYAGGTIPGIDQLPSHAAVASTIDSMLGIPGGEAAARAAISMSGVLNLSQKATECASRISTASVNPPDSSDEEDERPRVEQLLEANHAAKKRPLSSPKAKKVLTLTLTLTLTIEMVNREDQHREYNISNP